ncbi:hypothetical protein EDD18DRAFT_1180616 [Armillaria luteobubalina]|uniref:MYND-type domain-containing protein n=1 Tax=Armillaria luteobubalina TaxID=153913 RepID=A0AA39PZ28_9AGAR|nr:hypothetical protein EDD18DRAFT_1180616 [Armillaria luteobubalina]
MRESNFAFPAQNKACVCISSQLYDRRALDTSSALPLFNSLTHLTYLTSTSPRIREIMTMDGGLERLVKILHEFCLCPPPPENPALFYGLSPPNARPQKLTPALNPSSFDKHAAYRFSLAFQCVVNIGVRGSEPIRSRVVQAGTLEVVGCILEAWLAKKGFAVGPSSSATGLPRETREQRHARRQAIAEQRQREEAVDLARALQRQISVETSQSNTPVTSDTDADTSTEVSTTVTPLGSNTPTGSVVVPGRDRSGTIIARPVWDPAPPARPLNTAGTARPLPAPGARRRSRASPSPSTSTDTSRAETETEDDGDIDMDQPSRTADDDPSTSTSASASPSPERHSHHGSLGRRAVGIVSDAPATQVDLNTDAHIIINDARSEVMVGGDGGVEEGIVSLEQNDDFAMGAPPGAPGAIDEPTHVGMREPTRRRTADAPPEATPRPGTTPLPLPRGPIQRGGTVRGRTDATGGTEIGVTARSSHHHHHHRDAESGPYRDEDVLLSLQLLAYLSKYPHVRQAFYEPRLTFHPASANLSGGRYGSTSSSPAPSIKSSSSSSTLTPSSTSGSFFRAFRGRDKEKEKEKAPPVVPPAPSGSPRQTNVFSLVERFTFRPSSTETDMPNPPPRLPPEIQYWAGVIMRNACRKDESRGGIRQCANMLCGRWEEYPREFAKCRRCRKAKYCGKECQSTAWSEGHRFWCSAKDADDDDPSHPPPGPAPSSDGNGGSAGDGGGAGTVRRPRPLGNAGAAPTVGGGSGTRPTGGVPRTAAGGAAHHPTPSAIFVGQGDPRPVQVPVTTYRPRRERRLPAEALLNVLNEDQDARRRRAEATQTVTLTQDAIGIPRPPGPGPHSQLQGLTRPRPDVDLDMVLG